MRPAQCGTDTGRDLMQRNRKLILTAKTHGPSVSCFDPKRRRSCLTMLVIAREQRWSDFILPPGGGTPQIQGEIREQLCLCDFLLEKYSSLIFLFSLTTQFFLFLDPVVFKQLYHKRIKL